MPAPSSERLTADELRDLVHLKIPDHGRGFRALMGCHLPDWQERQRRLARWVVAGGQGTDIEERFYTT